METFESRKFRGADGLTIHGDVGGIVGAPIVVLLHGGGQTRHSWREAAQRFADCGYYVVNLDARGHGDSDWSAEGSYALERFAADVGEVLAHLPGEIALVGASLGGATALTLSAGNAFPISALVMADMVPRIEQAGSNRILAFMRAHLHGFANVEEAADAVAGYFPNRKRPRDTSGLIPYLRPRLDGRLHWHWDPRMVTGPDALDAVDYAEELIGACRQIKIPTLLVRGLRSDIVSDVGVAEFRSVLPQLEVFNIADATHMVAGDRNDLFAAAALEFLCLNVPPTRRS